MKLNVRLDKLEEKLPSSLKEPPIPHDYLTNPAARAEYAKACGFDPEVYEKARERILSAY